MPTTDLMNALPVTSVRFVLERGREQSGQANGVIRVKDLRPALWRARIQCAALTHREDRQAMALIGDIEDQIGTFYVWKPNAPYPYADPTGAVLGASAVKINSVNADNRRLSLKWLPAGYVLTRGDFVAFDYGSAPSRALHQVVDATVTANGSGVTPQFFVTPQIRPGAAANNVVSLALPAAEMRIVPGGYDPNTQGSTTSVSIDAVQVI